MEQKPKQAMHWEPYKKQGAKPDTVQCRLCPHNCIIAEGKRGICRVRENQKGKLYAMSYGRPVSTCVDPIEKKPLFHFLPGTDIFSIGTAGCNLKCLHCQNWEISQARPEDFPVRYISPEEIVEMAKEKKCPSIAYTYTEPTIFYEYVYDTARLAKEEGIKNVMVTNGFINEKPFRQLYPFIDAANVDLKGFSEKFYREVTFSRLKPVLDTLKRLKEIKTTWFEITNLIIPGKNDDMDEIKKMCEWIKENCGEQVPLHFSRFFPMYKMKDLPPTPEETLMKARDTAIEAGLKHVYIGNLWVEKEENTYCLKCGKLLIGRSGFGIITNNIRNGKCSFCKENVEGVWE